MQTGHCKNTVRNTLMEHGVVIREFRRDHKQGPILSKVMRSGGIPYGFTCLCGEMVVDPHEYKIVLQIYRHWIKGMSLRAIAKTLMDQKIKTRQGRPWRYEVIKKIIDRYNKQLKGRADGT